MVIEELGERGLIVKFSDEISPQIHEKILELDEFLSAKEGIELIPGYSSVTIFYDPLIISYEELIELVRSFASCELKKHKANTVEIPVMYGGEYGPDIEFVADLNGLSVEEFIKFHSRTSYEVWMMGFMPGFAYLYGYKGAKIPRLENPRKFVPAGSIGIAGNQSGIYPLDGPGGWRIIGRTNLKIFDVQRPSPFLFEIGDRIKFLPI